MPIVPAAILFDLSIGDSSIRPDAAAGYAACAAASREIPVEGNVGAGAGAMIGKLFGIDRAMRGGLGTASISVGGITVAALVAVNAMGDVVDPSDGRIVAGARAAGGRLPRHHGGVSSRRVAGSPRRRGNGASPASATTLAIVATDAVVTKPEATKMAQMAHDGLARTIRPIHTMSDGDIVFALGTGASGQQAHTTLLGALAADVLAEAVLRAVRAATALAGPGLPNLPAARDLPGTAMNDTETRHEPGLARRDHPPRIARSPPQPRPARCPCSAARPPPALIPARRSSSSMATATPPRCGRRRSGASRPNGWPRERLFAIDLPYPLGAQRGRQGAAGPHLGRRIHCITSPPR